LNEQKLAGLNRTAARGKRQATRKAILRADYRAICLACRKQPDSEQNGDDWSTPEDFHAVDGVAFRRDRSDC
jgi:hypothetical protein